MATIRGVIANNTGTARGNQYKKSAAVSARAFARGGALGKTVARRKSLGGAGG